MQTTTLTQIIPTSTAPKLQKWTNQNENERKGLL